MVKRLVRAGIAGVALALALAASGASASPAPPGADEAGGLQMVIEHCLSARTLGGADCVGRAERACLSHWNAASSVAEEDCALKERDAWNRLLPDAIRQAKGSLDDRRLSARLDTAQAVWLRWRAAEVKLISALTAGGTIQDTAAARRSSELTESRILDLRRTDLTPNYAEEP